MRFRLLSADDIFISYSRRDAATYAFGLADALTKAGFSCFLDRLGTDANAALPSSLMKKLKGCSMLVVVGTEGAARSWAVGQEVAEFARANGSSRIVPIDFRGALQEAEWLPQVVGIAAETEDVGALAHGNPSQPVVSRVEKAFGYARSKQRLRRYTALAAALLTVSLLAAGASYLYAQEQLKQARAASAASVAARQEAERERKAACEARQEAGEQARLAKEAEGKRGEAERKATEAAGKAADAERQQQLAEAREREATANAQRQEEIGESLRLATQGARRFGDNLELGLLLNAEALRAHDTYEARNGLLEALQHSPRLLGFLGVKEASKVNRAAAVSPGGGLLAAHEGNEIGVWDVAARRKLYSISMADAGLTAPREDEVRSLAFSADERTLAIGSYGALLLWDVARRAPARRIPLSDKDWVFLLKFDPTGRRLAFYGSISLGLHYVDLERPERPVKLTPVTQTFDIAFSPDGRLLAAAASQVVVWDLESPSQPGVRYEAKGTPEEGHRQSDFWRVAFSPRGDRLLGFERVVSAGLDRLVAWNVASREMIRAIELEEEVFSMAVGSRSGRVALGGYDGTIRLLDPDTLAEVEKISAGRRNFIIGLAFDDEERKLVSFGSKVAVWDVSGGGSPARVPGPVKEGSVLQMAAAPDGRFIAWQADPGPVILCDGRTGEPLGRALERSPNSVSGLAFTRDGGRLAALAYLDDESERGYALMIWDTDTGRLAAGPFRLGHEQVARMALSPDGKQFATANTAVIFRGAHDGGALGRPLEIPGGGGAYNVISAMAFSPDGGVFVYGTFGGRIFFVDAKTRRPLGDVSVDDNKSLSAIGSLAFSPDGKRLASTGPFVNHGDVPTAVLWDVATRSRLGEFAHPEVSAVRILAFSPDGRMLAAGATGLGTPGGASGDNLIVLWDVETRQPLGRPLQGLGGAVYQLAFSTSCEGCREDVRLASNTKDGSLVVWDASPASWQRRACWVANRRLTPAERASYQLKGGADGEGCAFPEEFYAVPLTAARVPASPARSK